MEKSPDTRNSPCSSISRKSSSLLAEVRVHGAFGQARLLRDLRQRRGRVSLPLEEPIGGTGELGSRLRFAFGPGSRCHRRSLSIDVPLVS